MAMSLHSEDGRGLNFTNLQQTRDCDAHQGPYEHFNVHIQSHLSAEGWRCLFLRETGLF